MRIFNWLKGLLKRKRPAALCNIDITAAPEELYTEVFKTLHLMAVPVYLLDEPPKIMTATEVLMRAHESFACMAEKAADAEQERINKGVPHWLEALYYRLWIRVNLLQAAKIHQGFGIGGIR